MAVWKIALALLLLVLFLGTLVLVFVLVRASLRRAIPETRERAEQALRTMLAPLGDEALSSIQTGPAGLQVSATLDGCAFELVYRAVGLVGVGRYPYRGLRLLILRVATPASQVERRRATLEAIAERFGGHGTIMGAVRVTEGWVEWHNPKREPGAEVVDVLRELVRP